MKKLLISYPDLLKEWHPTKNGGAQPEDFTHGSNRKVWWSCKKGHAWEATIKNRTVSNSGCPYCAGRLASKDNNLSLYPDLIKEWHPTKNGDDQPEDFTHGSNRKVWWRCQEGHEWKTAILTRTRQGTGCPYCSGNKVSDTNNLQQIYPKIASEWHPTKNGDAQPKDFTSKSSIKAWWSCKKGHAWEATIVNRTGSNSGCPYCAGKLASKDNNLSLYHDLIKEWHPTKNGDNQPEDFTIGSNRKVWWKCINGHEWDASVKTRTIMGANCPLCSNQSSKPEMRLLAELKHLFDDIKSRTKFEGIELDLYIPSLMIGIEFDGSYYHKSKEKKDLAKNVFFSNQRIKLIRVRHHPLKKISNLDIVVRNEMPTKTDLNKLVTQINSVSDLKMNRKISTYLKSTEFINEELFKLYISYFPSPLPERSLKILYPHLSDEWDFSRNNPLTPENFTPGSNQNVWWSCSKGHAWETAIINRTGRDSGCPFCSGNKVSDTNNLQQIYPKIASEWHPTKNGDAQPKDFTSKSSIKAWWSCKKGHAWEATIANRTVGHTGCPFCQRKKPSKEYNLLVMNPKLAKEWNNKMNGELYPNEFTPNSAKKVWWLCDYGHEWEAKIYQRNHGTGCPICYKENIASLHENKPIENLSDIKARTRAKPILCSDTNEIFSSALHAERVMRDRGYSVNADKVLLVCKGIRKKSGGFKWEFAK